eukprot:501754_1
MIDQKNENVEDSDEHWNIWISLVLILSAIDFISDINVLIGSTWHSKGVFYLSFTILLFQCVPYLLLIAQPKNIFSAISGNYVSITCLYYEQNHGLCAKNLRRWRQIIKRTVLFVYDHLSVAIVCVH